MDISGHRHTKVLTFDVYGTLLNTSSISKALEKHLNVSAEHADRISALWRTYQLEYTWRLNSMGIYEPFDEITRKSLLNATLDHGLGLTSLMITSICDAYQSLTEFPDAFATLRALNEQPNVHAVVFSNGTNEMVSSSLDAASLSPYAKARFLADSVKKYKPAPEIYRGLIQFVGKENNPDHVWLVSGNPFDVTGARMSGMNAIWVDRAGKGWVDRLLDPKVAGPTKIVRSLEEIPGYLQSL